MVKRSRSFCDEAGVTAIEFAMISPVLFIAILGTFDVAYDMYTASLMEGAIQKAARDSSLQSANTNMATIDGVVTKTVKDIAPKATVEFKRTAYFSFSSIGKPEDYTDTNSNGKCDGGEPYEDANANGRWDRDRGSDGLGGARDAVLYTVTVTYPRPFGVAGFLGWPRNATLDAKTVLANQPWDNLEKTAVVRKCS